MLIEVHVVTHEIFKFQVNVVDQTTCSVDDGLFVHTQNLFVASL